MNGISVNLHNYGSNFANLHIFSLTYMGDFEPYICKIVSFLFFNFFNFASSDANTLTFFFFLGMGCF